VASIHAKKNRAGNAYRVLWRQDGRQRSLTFETCLLQSVFKTLLEDHGPDEALRIIELDEIGRHVPTVTAWLSTHIDNLTGVQPALARYRTYSPATWTRYSGLCRSRRSLRRRSRGG